MSFSLRRYIWLILIPLPLALLVFGIQSNYEAQPLPTLMVLAICDDDGYTDCHLHPNPHCYLNAHAHIHGDLYAIGNGNGNLYGYTDAGSSST